MLRKLREFREQLNYLNFLNQQTISILLAYHTNRLLPYLNQILPFRLFAQVEWNAVISCQDIHLTGFQDTSSQIHHADVDRFIGGSA